MRYDEFELQVGPNGGLKATWKRASAEETLRKGELQLTTNEIELIDGYIRLLADPGLPGEQLRLLGKILYEKLFPSDIRSLYRQAIESVGKSKTGTPLRVYIDVDTQCRSAAHWPVEFLWSPDPGVMWLATHSGGITLCRRPSFDGREQKQKPPTVPLPLRVLVVVSRPREMGFVLTKALDDINRLADVEVDRTTPLSTRSNRGSKSRASHTKQKLIEVSVLGELQPTEQADNLNYLAQVASWQNLVTATRETDTPPHIIHFLGHGDIRDNKGCLALINPTTRKAEWCYGDELAMLMTDQTRLVVLQACQSAQAGTGPGFLSVADYLVRQNVPGVVAMQYAIRNDCATVFAAGFYRALADGLDVDAAVQKGRWSITAADNPPVRWNERHFGAPVLYMLYPFGVIQPPSPPTNLASPTVRSITDRQLVTGAARRRRHGEQVGRSLLVDIEAALLELEAALETGQPEAVPFLAHRFAMVLRHTDEEQWVQEVLDELEEARQGGHSEAYPYLVGKFRKILKGGSTIHAASMTIVKG